MACATACPLPWLHLSFNADTSQRVCCNTDHGGFVLQEDGSHVYLRDIQSVDRALNGKTHRDLRQAMVRGKRPAFCKTCYAVEDNGGTSVRQIYVKHYGAALAAMIRVTAPDGSIRPKIKYLDFSLSNLCNLKCRMCTPHASYRLKAEFDRLGFKYNTAYAERAQKGWVLEKPVINLLQAILPDVEEFLITGGEPFISRLHLEILEFAKALGVSRRIHLRYHTNVTALPRRLLELWNDFKSIEVHTSLEGYAEVNDFIRYPSQWATVAKNFLQLVEMKRQGRLWMEVHTVFQSLSVLRVTELLDFLLQVRFDIPAIPYFIWLDDPAYLRPNALPMSLRELAFERIEKFFQDKMSQYFEGPYAGWNLEKIGILRAHLKRALALPFSEELWGTFVQKTKLLDQSRKQNILEIMPDFLPFWPPERHLPQRSAEAPLDFGAAQR